ncbi:MAG TPA: SMI1/KNR4 family protein [Myxococcales bacterium]|nr:SMI1/KNR4 family protein [Myxococcales bacterium]
MKVDPKKVLNALSRRFPRFAAAVRAGKGMPFESVLPPMSASDIDLLEAELRVPLPESYKAFLAITRGFWLADGVVQLSAGHPFFHEFEEFEGLTPQRRQMVQRKGGSWPPPRDGMLCFAEYFLEADGDQALFDVAPGLQDGEYPVLYYAHEAHPPSVRPGARSFADWLERLLPLP